MLRSVLNLNHQTNRSSYSKLILFLRRQAEGYRRTHARVFTEKEMRELRGITNGSI